MSILGTIRSFLGKPNLKMTSQDEFVLRKMIADLRISANNMATMATSLLSERPVATYERDCDYYDTCPFRTSTKAKQDEFRRKNFAQYAQLNLFGTQDLPK